MSSRSSSQTELSLVEQTTLPKVIVKARGGAAQLQAYVNAYIVGREQEFMNGHWSTPLYYLSLVAMKGQGTTLQGIFARLVSTHTKDVFIEGIGEVTLAHHQSRLAECGYTIHWNFEQAEVLPNHDLHAVIESNMLTIADPVRGNAVKQREYRADKTSSGKRRKERASLSTVKTSKAQQSLAEIENREKHPLFLLMVPGWVQEEATFLEQLHLSFLDLRVPWPLDPSWASFLWERGMRRSEIERLKVWCYTPAPSTADEEPGVAPSEQAVPLLASAYFCRPKPASIQRDLQEALLTGRIHASASSEVVTLSTLPPVPQHEQEPVALAVAG